MFELNDRTSNAMFSHLWLLSGRMQAVRSVKRAAGCRTKKLTLLNNLQIYRKAAKGAKERKARQDFFDKQFSSAPLCALCGFAVRYWQLLA